MIKIMFVCYGNICRSPMAEFMMKDYVSRMGREKDFYISSSATSSEELGSPVHRGTKKVLEQHNIAYSDRTAVRLKNADYNDYDYFICMDQENLYDIKRIFSSDPQKKIKLLMSFTGKNKNVADPYWTRNFDKTYIDIRDGIKAFYDFLTKN